MQKMTDDEGRLSRLVEPVLDNDSKQYQNSSNLKKIITHKKTEILGKIVKRKGFAPKKMNGGTNEQPGPSLA